MLKRKRDISCINSPSYQIEEKSRSSSSSSITEDSIEIARSEVSSPEFHDSHSPLSNMQPPKSFSIQPGKISFNFVNPVKRRKIEANEESEIKSITSSTTTTTTSSSSIVSQSTMSEMRNQSILFSAKKYKPESAIKQINYPPKIAEYSDNSPVPPILLSTRKNTTTYKVEEFKEVKKDENIITVNNKEYLKKREVGKGGSGHVYEVTTSKNEILALKIIEIKSDEERKCIKSEIEYLEKFRGNKYIIQLIDYQITHDKIYIVYINIYFTI